MLVNGSLNWNSLSGGNEHTCGVSSSSAGYCWGFNDSGRLGDGTITQRWEPQTIIDAHVWRSISAGGYHTCGVTTSNTAYCWGLGSYGELGNGISAASSTPIQVSNPG